MDAEKFGAFIAEVRREQNMTQKQLAEKLHVTDKAVSRWERGVGFPDISLLEPLADTLGLTIAELIKSERMPQEEIPQKEVSGLLREAFALMGNQWEEKWETKRNISLFFIFLISAFVLLISTVLFWNQAIYVDEANTTLAQVLGGDFWLGMDWLLLGLLGVLTAVSMFSIFSKKKGPLFLALFTSSAAMFLSIGLLRNTLHYVERAGITLAAVAGGEFWAAMEWVRIPLLVAVVVLADVGLQVQEQQRRRLKTALRI